MGRGSEIGVLEVVDARARAFSERDETILTQLAQLASVAISNAQLYERERTIAQTLQRSLRPGALPDVPGPLRRRALPPGGRERRAGRRLLRPLPGGGGAWAALIGDVQGKGPDAAAVTALARHTLRAGAVYEAQPSGVLALLHKALREQRTDGRFCTVAHAHLRIERRPRARRARVRRASAAARPPSATASSSRSAGWDAARHRHRAPALRRHRRAREGDVLLLYTDGVTEVRRRRREVFGLGQLTELLSSCGGLPPDAVADRVERAVIGASEGRLRDDMAILALGPRPWADAHMLPRRAPSTEDIDG